jgi:mannose-6-phosphate isomerase
VAELPAVFEIGGVLRRHDWGSTTLMQQLCGAEPDGRPAAELWFGAHPGDPSPALGTTLDQVLDEPLPYLLKILAADRALSMQVHPTRAQAEAGFASEDAAGVPRDSRERNYLDRNHKPELLCAVTPFRGLCGFRPVAQTLDILDEAGIAELGFVADLLRGPDGLRAAFTAVLDHRDPAVLAAAVASSDHPLLWGARLAADDFPGDAGAALAVLLNAVELEPGQAIYLGAGNVHCYLRGLGVEVMANSDNVLRCGLTSKHVDVAEVLAVTDFTELLYPLWPAVAGRFAVPVPDFVLQRLEVAGDVAVDPDENGGPRIVLVTDGRLSVNEVALTPGRAALVCGGGTVRLSGEATAFVAQGAQGDGVSFAPK